MTSDALHVLQWFLTESWKLFSVPVPGFIDMTYGGFIIGMAAISIACTWLFQIFGRGGSFGYRSGSAARRIPKDREGDQK